MDYKKIVKSQSLRFAILGVLFWIPDSIMLRLQYKIKCSRWPNFNHPSRFTEKLQLYKMKYRNPLMQQCVDKYEVRKYIENKGLSSILCNLYGIYDSPFDIDFDKLPEQFVVKSTSGGGGINVIVVKEKRKIDIEQIRNTCASWISAGKMQANAGREWAYKGIGKTRIIIEEYLEDSQNSSLIDYKFFCFNGEPKFVYVITDRQPGEYAYLGVYDIQFNKLPVYRCDERRQEYAVPKPDNFDNMLKVVKVLSEDFPHVRVDLYNLNGKIYFGELTFYDGSGFFIYDPDSFDREVGSYFNIF